MFVCVSQEEGEEGSWAEVGEGGRWDRREVGETKAYIVMTIRFERLLCSLPHRHTTAVNIQPNDTTHVNTNYMHPLLVSLITMQLPALRSRGSPLPHGTGRKVWSMNTTAVLTAANARADTGAWRQIKLQLLAWVFRTAAIFINKLFVKTFARFTSSSH